MTVYSCSKKVKVLFILLSISVIAFAFIHSSMPSEISGKESEGVLTLLQDILKLFGFKGTISEHFIRKAAHFTEYTALGAMLMCTAFSFDKLRPYKYYINILFTGLATAVCDEAIQLNVEGRAGMITDTMLDFSGVIFGSVIFLIIFTIHKRHFVRNSVKSKMTNNQY